MSNESVTISSQALKELLQAKRELDEIRAATAEPDATKLQASKAASPAPQATDTIPPGESPSAMGPVPPPPTEAHSIPSLSQSMQQLTAAEDAGKIVAKAIANAAPIYAHVATAQVVAQPMRYGELYQLAIENYRQANGQGPLVSKLNPIVVNQICNAVEMGMTRIKAVTLSGLRKTDLDYYRRVAAEEREPYATFFALLDIAEARCEAFVVGAWQAQTRFSWQAAQAFLAKRFKADWGDHPVLNLTPDELKNKSRDELLAIVGTATDNINSFVDDDDHIIEQ